MKLLKKFIAGFCLVCGIPILLLGAIQIINPNTNPEDREGAVAAFIIFGLPLTGVGSWLLIDLAKEAKKQKESVSKQENDRLRAVVFKIISEQQGRVSVLRFAQEANISGETAKAFLDEMAIEFNANFDVSDSGAITYHFQV